MDEIILDMNRVYMNYIIDNLQYSTPYIIDDKYGINESDYRYNDGILFDNIPYVENKLICITYAKWINIVNVCEYYSTPVLCIDN
jgi:hypothetical protein